jgi:hypothetical protein
MVNEGYKLTVFVFQRKRFLLACLSIFQPVGVVICSAIAIAFIPNFSCSPNFSEADALPSCATAEDGVACCSRDANMGWRYLLFTLGAITIAIFFLRFFVFTFHETPKFLIYRGRDAEAISTLQHMSNMNGNECHITMDTFMALECDASSTGTEDSAQPMFGSIKVSRANWREKLGLEITRYKMLFDGFQMTRLTILVWLTYIMDFWGFTVAGEYSRRSIWNTANAR